MGLIFKSDTETELARAFQTIENRFEFIWGVASNKEDTPSLNTINDIDIVLDKQDSMYMLELETAYRFTTKRDECRYLVYLLDNFHKWMEEKGYSCEEKLPIWSGISLCAHTIEELYAQFLVYVVGYCNTYQDDLSPSENNEFFEYTSWNPND